MTNTPTVSMPELKMIALTAILPSRLDEELSLSSRKTATIRASIQEFGIIEPLLVFPMARTKPQQYLLVDGHLRLSILNAMKVTEILCLITHDDETYSVDACVSALAPIQAHYMIIRAIARGVSEARIARVLRVDVYRIREKRNLLDGICPEAIALLKDKEIGEKSLRLLRKVTPARQVSIARMMNSLCNYTSTFLQAMISTTRPEQRILSKSDKRKESMHPGDLAALERELEVLHRRITQYGTTYGDTFTRLTQVRGYLNRLLDHPKIVRYLLARFPDQLRGFHKVLEFTALEEPEPALDDAAFPDAVPAS